MSEYLDDDFPASLWMMYCW